ncbi:cell division protein FtsH [Fusobacterium necrophorum subsp. funduliforme]|uniref:ATP-dependent zinc metalloprotease FtsH n=1 Tax=Fusobacterium necrophorum subsp. funduliforme TaxID=143387 RepID=A0A162IWX3_9FUSO|nr:ATP-dependent zinc metalloprotease FtsH [Fusobacterium necrophorum]AYV92721.1 ATP-dependent zinc metalloprotease FtsH [Fusobacterium necrophorum subsp. funduliforme]KYL04613.1 cell division protein FtsH [Fusobacterium necrophorum subsp. funduliforme]KYM44264.1 cell division protein FtsH [Fusobacterium necrophorum subsp. funduliforme]KYM62064.1 cell division protein FtsH [Fusobacterium necrophorum subsp. funduliforme]KYM65668.1 cell division protein FtsH [Fusobacterium necrophorum subsp. fun
MSDKQEKDSLEQEEQKEIQVSNPEDNNGKKETEAPCIEKESKEEEIQKTLEEENKSTDSSEEKENPRIEKRIYVNNEEDLKKILRESFGNAKNNRNPKKMGGKFNFVGFLLLIFIVAVALSFPKFMKDSKSNEEIREVSYTTFVKSIEEKQFQRVEEREGYLYGYSSSEKGEFRLNIAEAKTESTPVIVYKARMITDRLGSDSLLLSKMEDAGLDVKAIPLAQTPFILNLLASWLPILLLIGVWIFMLRGVGKGGGGGPQIFNVGKSKAKENGENITQVSFADVAGIDEAKHELEEVVEFLREPEKFKKIGARIPKGVLLLGSPGTGKTLLAKAVAGEAKVPFFSMSGSEFVEMFVGVGASRVRDLFAKARKNAPCIVFIDEIDAVGRKRGTGQGGGNDEREQTLNQLLVEMDGFGNEETIIVLAATNRPDVLDRALKRPGRFDRQVYVDKPDLKGRVEILKVHAKNKKFSKDVNFETIGKKTAGLVGADLANILNEAAIIAARANRDEINMMDLEEASEKVEMGPEKKSKVVSERDKKLTAYHETGHAIARYALGSEEKVHKITIIPRGAAGGYTMSLPAEEKNYQTKQDLLDFMVFAYGGRAAEEIVFGKENISTGASNDIQRATAYAKAIVTRFGMVEEFGPILLDGTQEGDMFERKYYSEQTGKEIDDVVRKIIKTQYQKTLDILIKHRDKLEAVTKVILEKETIMGDEFEKIMSADTKEFTNEV